MTLAEHFKALGDAELVGNDGLAFAITLKCIEDDFGGDKEKAIAAFPQVGYEHRIYFDELTDNFIVLRPNAQGEYWCRPLFTCTSLPHKWQRIR